MNFHRHALARRPRPRPGHGRGRPDPAPPPVEAVHDRAVHGHDVGDGAPRSPRTRSASSSRPTRPASSTCTACPWRAAPRRPSRSSTGGLDLRGLLLPRRRPRCSSPATRAATSSTTSTSASADGAGEGPHAGREAEGDLPGLDAGRRRLLRADQRARPEVLRPLPLRREDLRAHASSTRTRPATSWARSPTTGGSSPSRKPGTTADNDLYLWDAQNEGDEAPAPPGAAPTYSPEDFDPASKAPLLPDQRRRRVHARAPLRPRRRPPRGRGEGGLGRHVHVLLARRPLPRHRRSTRTRAR